MAERAITNVEAGVAAKALIDHFFHNDAPKPNIRIPATEEDTDLVLTRYIKQQAARDAAIGELVRAVTARREVDNMTYREWAEKYPTAAERATFDRKLDADLDSALAAYKAVQHG